MRNPVVVCKGCGWPNMRGRGGGEGGGAEDRHWLPPIPWLAPSPQNRRDRGRISITEPPSSAAPIMGPIQDGLAINAPMYQSPRHHATRQFKTTTDPDPDRPANLVRALSLSHTRSHAKTGMEKERLPPSNTLVLHGLPNGCVAWRDRRSGWCGESAAS